MVEHKNGAVSMAAASDIGTVRKQNEDYYFYSTTHTFFIVCDGMGGHKSGALASKIAGETLRDVLTNEGQVDFARICEDIDEDLPAPALKLIAGVRLANRRIVTEAANNPEHRGMGSTIVAALLYKDWFFTINVGDSRIYRLRNSRLDSLTKDHSWINELIEDREISEKEIQHFSKKNVLTRALGIYPTVKIDLRIENIKANDLYLLCSDGLHNALSEELLQSVLTAKHKSMQKMVDKLVLSAKQMNGSDNITGGVFLVSEQSNGALTSTSYEKTIVDETPKITALLDREIKTIYPPSKAGGERPVKWFAACGVIVLIASLIGFLIWHGKGKKNEDRPITASALLTQEFSSLEEVSQVVNQAQVKNAGSIVVLQIKDTKYINLLQSLNDIRILDYVTQFNKRLPVYAGKYTWAIADSGQRIIYQNNNLLLESLESWERKPGASKVFDSTQNSNTRDLANGTGSRNQQQGKIFLMKTSASNNYKNAIVFVGENRLGPLVNYSDGINLKPGNYTISLRDASGNVLKTWPNQTVVAGGIFAIEF